MFEFLKRHRRKFYFLGGFIGGSWMLYRYMWKKIQEIREEEDKQYLITVRRQHHFDSNQRTCNVTVLAMVPNLRDALVKNLDTESLKDMLKTNPPNKLELWEELKIMSFTRTMCSVYGVCMLSVMLRVQLNIVSGYLYLETLHPTKSSNKSTDNSFSIPPKVRERYLSLVKVFMDQGFVDFIHYLKHAVMKEVGGLPLKEPLTLDHVTSVLEHVRERVECGVDKPTQSLYPFLLTSERVASLQTMLSPEDQQLEKLIGETRDIYESPDFHTVLRESIDRGFHNLLDGLAEHYKQLVPEATSGIHDVSIVMAKLIPVVNSQLDRIVGDAPNQFVQEQLLMEELKVLAANIYEAFSQDPSEIPSI